MTQKDPEPESAQQTVYFPLVGGAGGAIASIRVVNRFQTADGTTPLVAGAGLFGQPNLRRIHDILVTGREPGGGRVRDHRVVVNFFDVPDTGVDIDGRDFLGTSFGLALVIADFLALPRTDLVLRGLPPIDRNSHIVATGIIDGRGSGVKVGAIGSFGAKLRCVADAHAAAPQDAEWVFLYPAENHPGKDSPDYELLTTLAERGVRCHSVNTWDPSGHTAKLPQPPQHPPPPPPPPPRPPPAGLPRWLCPTDVDCLERLGRWTLATAIAATLLGLASLVLYH